MCQVALAQQDQNLVRLLADEFALELETWVTMHGDLRGSRRCRIVFDALVACLQEYAGGCN